MENLTVAEKVEMCFIYGEAGRNMQDACRLYAERFPDRRHPGIRSFYRVVHQFSEEGSVQPKKRQRRRTVTGEENEITVLASIANTPQVSSRALSHDLGISRTSVLRILKRHKFHPYHISLHQELHGDDFQNRVIFCRWAREQLQNDGNFFRRVLFSDESTFTNYGTVNRHNMHYWSVDNPRWLREVESQRQWTVNVWCGIIGDSLIGPFFIDGILTGEKYTQFLNEQLPQLLEDMPLQERMTMWYQHDGCPAHYAVTSREVLDRNYPGRWIGRGGPVPWPARSPDLTSPDFFLWGHLKGQVYKELPTTPDNMKERIRIACRNINRDVLLRTVQSFAVRIEKCIEVHGHHFEHLLD